MEYGVHIVCILQIESLLIFAESITYISVFILMNNMPEKHPIVIIGEMGGNKGEKIQEILMQNVIFTFVRASVNNTRNLIKCDITFV